MGWFGDLLTWIENLAEKLFTGLLWIGGIFVAGMLLTGFGQTVPGYGPPPGYGPTIPGYGPDTSVHGPQPGYSPMPPGYGSQPSGPGPSTVGPSAPYTDFGVV